jgi:hypothetical protein
MVVQSPTKQSTTMVRIPNPGLPMEEFLAACSDTVHSFHKRRNASLVAASAGAVCPRAIRLSWGNADQINFRFDHNVALNSSLALKVTEKERSKEFENAATSVHFAGCR